MSTDLAVFLERLPGRAQVFTAGAAVFQVGDLVQRVHIMRAGIVHLVRHQPDGSMLVLQRAVAGSVVAEASVYSERYHCVARAATDAVVWSVSRRDLLRRFSESRELEQAWSRHLAHEVQRARLHAEILSIRTVAARLDAWCAWYGALPAKGQWAGIAHQIGVSAEALYREIARRRRGPQVSA